MEPPYAVAMLVLSRSLGWKRAVLIAVGFLNLFGSARVPGQSLVNGSFEYGAAYWSFSPGAAIAGWTLGRPVGTDGTHAVKLTSRDWAVGISQTVQLRPSWDYTLSFDWAVEGPAGESGVLIVRAIGSESKAYGHWTLTNRASGEAILGARGFQQKAIYFSAPFGHSVTRFSFSRSAGDHPSVSILLDHVFLDGNDRIVIPEGPRVYQGVQLVRFFGLSGADRSGGIEFTDSLRTEGIRWQTLTNQTNAGRLNLAVDLGSTNAPTRFYRPRDASVAMNLSIAPVTALIVSIPPPTLSVYIQYLESIFDTNSRWVVLTNIFRGPTGSSVIAFTDRDRFYRARVLLGP